VQKQKQVATTNISGWISARGIEPVDNHSLLGRADNILRMEVAVTQTIAVRHPFKAAQQSRLARRIELCRLADIRREPCCYPAKPDRLMLVNTLVCRAMWPR